MISSTRQAWKCPILGVPSELKPNVLPTIKDVLCHIIFCNKQNITKAYNPPFKSVANQVEDIWLKTLIPTISQPRIIFCIKKHYNTRALLLKTSQSTKQESLAFKLKKQKFVDSCDHLFDIAACKCKTFYLCECAKERKVSKKIDSLIRTRTLTTHIYIIHIFNILYSRYRNMRRIS